MSKYNSRYEYMHESMVDWLQDFAEKEASKEPIKQSNYMTNILDIVSRNKKNSVEAKVEELRERVGLDLLEKSGTDAAESKEATASVMHLSLRHKLASDDQTMMNNAKEFVTHTVANRNGHVNTLAILDLLNKQLGLDDKWIKEHKDDLLAMIEQTKEESPSKEYSRISPEQLARNEQEEERDEPPLFLPSNQGNG